MPAAGGKPRTTEFSCRAGKDNLRYCFGDDDAKLDDYCWSKTNSSGGTKQVGKKEPNDWGLYDMHGNVWEWCQDNYDPNYYRTSPKQDPTGPSTGERVFRGGSWRYKPVYCRCAFRGAYVPDFRDNFLGFRVLLVSPSRATGTGFTDADRRAAEYVLSIGGTVRVDGNDSDIRAKGDLPTGAIALTNVNLGSNKQVTDEGLAVFKDCKNVTWLNLGGTSVTDAGLAHFKGMPLKLLWIDHTDITDLTLLQGMPLRDIRLTPKNITRGEVDPIV